MIHWIERSPELYEARLTLPDGRDAYVGYVAVTPGAAVWRGYAGLTFTPLGTGHRAMMQRAVEQRVAEILRHGGLGQQPAKVEVSDDAAGQVYDGEGSGP